MSSLIVNITTIEKLTPHPNADLLEIAHIEGTTWQIVVQKGQFQQGSKVVYFPVESMIPYSWAETFGVTRYLTFSKNDPEYGRIRCAKLRGEPSFGLAVPVADNTWPVGLGVANYYNAKKYTPPPKILSGDAEKDHPLLVNYTDIENLRNFPDMFLNDEFVEITEKRHGTLCKIALINGAKMASSKNIRRREPEDYKTNRYWFPWSIPGIPELLDSCNDCKQVILFGEVFGRGIQNLEYNQKGLAFEPFDLMLDGNYVERDTFHYLCQKFHVTHVPVLYTGVFSLDIVRQHASGKATGANHIREGVVIRPMGERNDPRVGRVIAKYISDEYLLKLYDEFGDE